MTKNKTRGLRVLEKLFFLFHFKPYLRRESVNEKYPCFKWRLQKMKEVLAPQINLIHLLETGEGDLILACVFDGAWGLYSLLFCFYQKKRLIKKTKEAMCKARVGKTMTKLNV